MTFHDRRALSAQINISATTAALFCLDQFRMFAASRLCGSALPHDRAIDALNALLPPAMAQRVFGACYECVRLIAEGHQGAFSWYPATCRWPSSEECVVLDAIHQAFADERSLLECTSQILVGIERLAAFADAMMALVDAIRCVNSSPSCLMVHIPVPMQRTIPANCTHTL